MQRRKRLSYPQAHPVGVIVLNHYGADPVGAVARAGNRNAGWPCDEGIINDTLLQQARNASDFIEVAAIRIKIDHRHMFTAAQGRR